MGRIEVIPRLLDTFSRALWGIPANCALCQRPISGRPECHGVCPECRGEMAIEMSRVCLYCGIPVRSSTRCCPECLKRLHSFDCQRSAGLYRGHLRSAIARMKYGGERWLSRPLGRLLAETAARLESADMIVPVPLDPKSASKRGFNQAEDLALEASVHLSIPIARALVRAQRGEHQAALSRSKRWRNIIGSMAPNGEVDVSGKTVLLVDDVMTTGATLNEAARVLKGMGAKTVLAVTVARTVRH